MHDENAVRMFPDYWKAVASAEMELGFDWRHATTPQSETHNPKSP